MLEIWEQDPEFAGLSKEDKTRFLLNYFDDELADDEFRALSTKEQDEIRINFLQNEGIKPDLTFGRIIRQSARSAWQGLGNIVRYMAAAENQVSFDELIEADPYMNWIAKNSTPEEIETYRQDFDKRQIQRKSTMEKFVESLPEPRPGSSGRVEDAARGMAEFLLAMGVSVFSPLSSIPVTFASIGGAKYEEFKSQGIDDDHAYVAATLSAAAQTPIESLGNLFQVRALKAVATPLLKGIPANKAVSFLTTIFKNAAAEGVEEYLQQFPDELSNLYAANPDATPDELWEEFKNRLPEIQDSAIEAAKTGALGGGMLAGIAGVIQAPAQLSEYKIERQRRIDEKKVEEEGKKEFKAIVNEQLDLLKKGETTPYEIRTVAKELFQSEDAIDQRTAEAFDEALSRFETEKAPTEKRIEDAETFAKENPDLVALANRINEINEETRQKVEKGRLKEDELDKDLVKWVFRAEEHIPKGATEIEAKSKFVEGLTDAEVVEAVKLINPILEQAKKFQDRKVKAAAEKVIKDHPELYKIINSIVPEQKIKKEGEEHARAVRERGPGEGEEAGKAGEVAPEKGRELEEGHRPIRVRHPEKDRVEAEPSEELPEKVEPKAKEPWEILRENYVGEGYIQTNRVTDLALKRQVNEWQKKVDALPDSEGAQEGLARAIRKQNRANEHKEFVQQALSEGRKVPPEVLKDYPDLVKEKPQKKALPKRRHPKSVPCVVP